MQPSVDRPQLRRLLARVLKTSSDFDAFCLDYFHDIYRRLDAGMERTSKLNVLLALAEPMEILDRLTDAYPEIVAQNLAAIKSNHGDLLLQQREQNLANQLAERIKEFDVLRKYGADTSSVESAIDDARRALRRGPYLNSGEVLAAQFQLISLLGEGTFADVWEAQNLNPGETIPEKVAIKVLHGNQTRDKNRRDRFINGAAQMRLLLHRHIVRVFSDVAEYEGFIYFVMEYLEGSDLYDAVRVNPFKIPRTQWVRAVLQVGEALALAHERGLVHRDVKPQNILLDREGNACLTDFDLVLDRARFRMTRTNMALGTLAYSAPEQLDDAAHIDVRADIYSLGRTTMFLLYGDDLPSESFHNRDSFLEKLVHNTELRNILSKATAWDPKLRYTDISTYCTELRKLFPDLDSSTEIVPPLPMPPGSGQLTIGQQVGSGSSPSRPSMEILVNLMRENKGDFSKVAKSLNISRHMLYRLINRYSIDINKYRKD